MQQMSEAAFSPQQKFRNAKELAMELTPPGKGRRPYGQVADLQVFRVCIVMSTNTNAGRDTGSGSIHRGVIMKVSIYLLRLSPEGVFMLISSFHSLL